MLNRCPACDAPASDPFFSVTGLPVHGTAVLPDPVSARSVATGDQVLVLCERCGLMFNRDFDPGLLDYTGDHEESQHHSPLRRLRRGDHRGLGGAVRPGRTARRRGGLRVR